MASFARKFIVTATLAGTMHLPMSAQAMTQQEFLTIFTPQNFQQLFPGLTSTQYTQISDATTSTLSGNANCLATYNEYFNQGLNDPPSYDSCIGALTTAINTAATLGLTSAEVDQNFLLMYYTYANQVITPVITQQIQESTSFRQADQISRALSSAGNARRQSGPARVALTSGMSGMAAGSMPSKTNMWLSAATDSIKNTLASSRYDGDVRNFIGGADYTLDSGVVIGLSLARDDLKMNTAYNGGKLEVSSWMAAPYISHVINDTWSIDASAGFAWGKSDVTWRTSTGGNDKTTQNLTRNYQAINLNAQQWRGETEYAGKVKLTRAEERLDANTALLTAAKKNSITQLGVVGRVGQWMNNYQPYVELAYTYDLARTDYDKLPTELKDKDGWNIVLGIDIFSKKGMTGGVMYSKQMGRHYLKSDALMGNINYRF
ncbi:MAG: hypothetical protein A2045_09330 [Rhodocyclales bacterium GWA2_65_20]|nr:MAG: hypothetical protein A2045_09330 [Rhodocyclales bacterium GWA2_65_20]